LGVRATMPTKLGRNRGRGGKVEAFHSEGLSDILKIRAPSSGFVNQEEIIGFILKDNGKKKTALPQYKLTGVRDKCLDSVGEAQSKYRKEKPRSPAEGSKNSRQRSNQDTWLLPRSWGENDKQGGKRGERRSQRILSTSRLYFLPGPVGGRGGGPLRGGIFWNYKQTLGSAKAA